MPPKCNQNTPKNKVNEPKAKTTRLIQKEKQAEQERQTKRSSEQEREKDDVAKTEDAGLSETTQEWQN